MTHIALRGMAANELGRARISMMVRSISSNTRPDTLVQDRTLQLGFSLATHGGSIHLGQTRPSWPRRQVHLCPLSLQKRPSRCLALNGRNVPRADSCGTAKVHHPIIEPKGDRLAWWNCLPRRSAAPLQPARLRQLLQRHASQSLSGRRRWQKCPVDSSPADAGPSRYPLQSTRTL